MVVIDRMQRDTTFSFSPEPKLHAQRRSESALFDIRSLAELQVAHADAKTKRAPAGTGFVDVKALLGVDHTSSARTMVPPSRGLVPLPPPRAAVIVAPDRNAAARRVLWALCIGMFAVLAVMSFAVLR